MLWGLMCLHNPLTCIDLRFFRILIPKVFKYLNSLKLLYTLVVPDVIPRRFWWPLLLSACSSSSLLASKGASGVLLTPSRDGILGDRPIPWDLWVFRISNN